MRLAHLVTTFAVIYSAATLALPLATVAAQFQCEEPRGKRVDLGTELNIEGETLNSIDEGARWGDDGFSNMRPIVLINAHFMRVVWGDMVPDELVGIFRPDTRIIEVPITHRDNISVAGTVAGGRTVDQFRYYFNYNALFRLQSSVALVLQSPETAPAMAAVYVSRCKQIR
jgi:hypothetical protein